MLVPYENKSGRQSMTDGHPRFSRLQDPAWLPFQGGPHLSWFQRIGRSMEAVSRDRQGYYRLRLYKAKKPPKAIGKPEITSGLVLLTKCNPIGHLLRILCTNQTPASDTQINSRLYEHISLIGFRRKIQFAVLECNRLTAIRPDTQAG